MRKLRFLQAIFTLMVAFAFAGMGKITAYAAGSDVVFEIGSDGNQLKDLSGVKGLSWDANKSVLIMDGYNGGAIRVESTSELQKVEVVVKGENSIKFGNGEYGFDLNNIDAKFSGTGELNINMEGDIPQFCVGMGNSKGSNVNYPNVEINGPTINFMKGYNKAVLLVNDLIMTSGKLYFEMSTMDVNPRVLQNQVIIVHRSAKISGGTIVVTYLDSKEVSDVWPIIYIKVTDAEVGPLGFIDNCAFVIIGDEKITSKVNITGCWKQGGGIIKDIDIKKGDNVIVEKTPLLYYFKGIDINKFKATLLQLKYTYDGKAKTPKVTLGGLVENVDYTVKYENNVNPGKATAVVTGKGLYTGEIKLDFVIENSANGANNGQKNVVGNQIKESDYVYEVINSKEVKLVGLNNKNLKKIKVANTVTINNVTYKVTQIGANAFNGNKKIKSVVIGKNVTTIGKKAFFNCKKLKTVKINSKKLKKIGKKAFYRKGGKKLTITVPKKSKKKYVKLIKTAKTNKYKVK